MSVFVNISRQPWREGQNDTENSAGLYDTPVPPEARDGNLCHAQKEMKETPDHDDAHDIRDSEQGQAYGMVRRQIDNTLIQAPKRQCYMGAGKIKNDLRAPDKIGVYPNQSGQNLSH